MSREKKAVRSAFRDAVLRRDGHRCRVCGREARTSNLEPRTSNESIDLAAHHITNRELVPHGGYVRENGIALCSQCHEQAEAGEAGFEPAALYALIGSSAEIAAAEARAKGPRGEAIESATLGWVWGAEKTS